MVNSGLSAGGNARRLILYLCAAGLVVRLAFLLFFDPGIVFSDEKHYWAAAVNVAERGSSDTGGQKALVMPLTPIVLGLFVKVTGTGLMGVKVLLVIVSSLTIYFVARIALLIHPSRPTVWIAGLAAALYPFFVFFSVLACSETFFLFFLSVFFFLLLRETGAGCVTAGFVAGLCHLTRPTLLAFLPFIWIWQRVYARMRWKHILLSIALFAVTILPWIVRNYSVFGEFVAGTSSFGHVLLEGNNPYNETGGVGGSDLRYLEGMPSGLGELEADDWQRARAIENIRANPGRFLRLAVRKFLRFWNLWPNTSLYGDARYRLISLLSFGPVLILSLLAIPIFGDRRVVLIWLFACYYTVVHMVTIGSLRYRLPLEPLLVALASAALAWLWTDRRWPLGASFTGSPDRRRTAARTHDG